MTAQYDIIIRGGTVVDGTGAAPVVADVAIAGGIIQAVGTVDATAREEIDATGRLVTPGFIDLHTHYDGQAVWSERMNPSSTHGVTTVILGNCGVGFAPCRPEDRELMCATMEGVEDIPGVVMKEGPDKRTFASPDPGTRLIAERIFEKAGITGVRHFGAVFDDFAQ